MNRNNSYYDRNRHSAALIRARRPYLVKNAVTGLATAGIAIGVYLWTIRLIGQDEFEDVKVPDGPVPITNQINQPAKETKAGR